VRESIYSVIFKKTRAMKSIYERFTKRALLTILIIQLTLLGYSTTYYISTIGNDANSGLSEALAWKTLTKVNATSLQPDDQVLFRKGDTFYGQIKITHAGIAGHPIIFGAYGIGANPIITGFTTLNEWTNEGSGIYSKVISAPNLTNMVTVDGVQYGMGKYPNTGHLTYESASTSVSITDNDLPSSPNWTGAEIVLTKNEWIIDRCLITNHTNHTITYNDYVETSSAIAPNNYFIQNDVRTLDQFGEWYHDVNTGKFYMYFGAVDPNTKTVKVATQNYICYDYQGDDNFTLQNITFQGSIKENIYITGGCDNVAIYDCNVLNSGTTAIFTSGANTQINRNIITDCNGIGILPYGASPIISYNTLTNVGIIEGQGCLPYLYRAAIYLYTSSDPIVYRNTMTNMGYCGIATSPKVLTGTFTNNYIKNSCILRPDLGAIYTTNNKTLMTISDNVIITSGGCGIYLDEYSSNIKTYRNTISDCAYAIKLHKAHDIAVKYNTVFDNGVGVDIQNWLNVNNIYNDSITDNVVVAKESAQRVLNFSQQYASYNFGISSNNYYCRPIDDNMSFTVYYMSLGSLQKSLANWQTLTGQDANSHKSPQSITSESDLQFEYNTTSKAKTVSLSRPMIDVKGSKYPTTVTLQPYTSIVLMKDLTSPGAPGAPTSVVATAGNASASVTFAAPTNNGGSAITGYTVTSIPAGGIDSNAGSTSLNHSITGLINGTAYTFTVKAINLVGTSVASLASNSVVPKAPTATSFTFTGPSSGNVNSASSNFTVTPNNTYTGTITITPTGAGSAGLSAKVLTFSNSSTAQTFSITPIVAGSITLTPTNNGTLTNPVNLVYTAKAILPNAPTSVAATAGDASALVTFVAPTNTGGSAITGYTVTSIPTGGVDTNAGSTSLTHSIGGLTNGTSYTFTVKAINSVGSSVASIASNSITPKVADVITKQGDIIPSHFKTVWEGLNGLNHMNINVVSATLENVPLSVDDEIAAFSGLKCVGTTKLTKSIVSSDNTTFLSILASQDDGSGNGFSDNDTIVFKIWDSKTQSELQVNGVVYRNDVSSWKTNGKYSPGATTVVEIASYSVITQSIELLKGYNMISTYVSVQNPNVSAVTKSLQNQGSLIKMQDETGNSFENWGDFGGWINQLGSMEETEGYKIQVANNCTLQVTGRSIAMPFDISLKTGWNIISYPRTDMVNAMNVFQALIDQNKLVKVQDEAGNSIENWGLFGGWKNGIGNLIPGKAYKVKISADAILTFQESYPKSAVVLAKAEQTEYYHSSVEGNGTDHMNINITGLNGIGISVGDEIAAFDGAVCVATTKITEASIMSDAVSLASSFSTNDQNPDGFKVGDQIKISTWSKLSGDESKVNTEVITGQMKYEKNASVLIKMMSATIATGITNLNDVVKIDVFPNPCQDRVTVRFSKIPEADSRIEISDISGRKLITRPISGNTEEINLDSFTPGLYLVKSILGKNEYVQKLIVNK
jgi:parallel beta-helix repeat protein